MLMSTPSAQCFPHEVTHTLYTWKGDPDGGRTVATQTVRRQIAAAVQPGGPQRLVETDEQGGLRRITILTPYRVIYPENPRLNIDDLVVWTEDDGGDDFGPIKHTIVVTGSRNAAGMGSVWEVTGEERS